MLKVKIKQAGNKYYMDVNDRRNRVTKVGYNEMGSFIYIMTLDGEPFRNGASNPVVIYILDETDLFEKAFWLGREDNYLKCFLNELYKSVFLLQIPSVETN